MNRIKSLTIVANPGVKQYFADKDILIIDCSKEYPDHTEFIFEVRDTGNKLIAKIINCPVNIEYSEEI